MIVEGEHTFPAPPDAVWPILFEPEVLAKAMPGVRKLDRKEDNHYSGSMRVGVGPVSGEFTVDIKLSDIDELSGYTMHIDSRSPIGFTRGDARVDLSPGESGTTLMRYKADLQIGGKVAGVGQRLLDQVAKMMTAHGLKTLSKEVEERLAEKAEE